MAIPYTTGAEPAIWTLAPVVPSGLQCVGNQFDAFANNLHDGWACMAVRAGDKLGNVQVSRVLRVCVDHDGVGNECPHQSIIGITNATPIEHHHVGAARALQRRRHRDQPRRRDRRQRPLDRDRHRGRTRSRSTARSRTTCTPATGSARLGAFERVARLHRDADVDPAGDGDVVAEVYAVEPVSVEGSADDLLSARVLQNCGGAARYQTLAFSPRVASFAAPAPACCTRTSARGSASPTRTS